MNPLGYSVSAGQGLEDVKRAHKLLRQELSSINHWRRLLRARMDLSIALAAPPFPLAAQLNEYFDSSELTNSHELRDLPNVILNGLKEFPVTALPALKKLETDLREYERSVRTNYMILSEELAQSHAR